MQYTPRHYNVRARSIHCELSLEGATTLERLHFITNLYDLLTRRKHAKEWFARTMKTFSYERLHKSLYKA